MHPLPWNLTLKVTACAFHGAAIASTVFRLTYRWHIACFWWEDGWAMFALAADVLCLASALLEAPVAVQGVLPHETSLWMAAMGFTCVLWACRTSILFSIVRVTNPSCQLRRIACVVGCSFLVMWAALMGQKIQVCLVNSCHITSPVAISQLVTDVISDVSLVVLPVYFLRSSIIDYRQRIMIFSAFSASLLITVVTILHSAMLLTVRLGRDGIIVVAHIKTALSLIVCNLLMIMAFVYRLCRKSPGDLDAGGEGIAFTTVDLNVCPFTESTADKRTTTVEQHSRVSETSRWTARGAIELEGAEGVAPGSGLA